MTPRQDDEKCKNWVIYNGEEYECQWEKEHIGAHSVWVENKKIKWPNNAEALQSKEKSVAGKCADIADDMDEPRFLGSHIAEAIRKRFLGER